MGFKKGPPKKGKAAPAKMPAKMPPNAAPKGGKGGKVAKAGKASPLMSPIRKAMLPPTNPMNPTNAGANC